MRERARVGSNEGRPATLYTYNPRHALDGAGWDDQRGPNGTEGKAVSGASGYQGQERRYRMPGDRAMGAGGGVGLHLG